MGTTALFKCECYMYRFILIFRFSYHSGMRLRYIFKFNESVKESSPIEI